ncbi:MAG: ankyrin repeat domain-containing protein [bacterium]
MYDKQTPLPTLGEVVKFIIDAFGFNEGAIGNGEAERKKFRRRLKRFAKEKDFNIEKGNEFIEEAFGKYIREIFKEDEVQVKMVFNIFSYFFSSYKDLVLKLETKYCNRYYSLLSIMPHFLSYIANLYFYLEDNLNLSQPDKKLWFTINANDGKILYPINLVLNWWEKKIKYSDLTEMAKGFSGEKEISENGSEEWLNYYKKIMRWKGKENLPSAYSIFRLNDMELDIDNGGENKKLLIIYLFIARAFQYAISKFLDYYDKDITTEEGIKFYNDFFYQFIKKNYESNNKHRELHTKKQIQIFLNYAVGAKKIEDNIDMFCLLSKDAQVEIEDLMGELDKLTDLYTNKKDYDKEKALEKLDVIENITFGLNPEDDEERVEYKIIDYYYKYYLLWKEARIRLLSGQLEEAAQLYLEAFNEGRYRAGEDLKEIIKEGYCLAAYLVNDENKNTTKIMKEMHKWGHLYRLFEEKYDEVKDWIVPLLKKQFFDIIPIHSYYPSIDIDILRKLLLEEKYIDKYNLNNPDRDLTEWEQEKVADNPNEINQLNEYSYITYNQVMKFAIINQFKKLKSAIENGGRLDISNNDNATCLLYSISQGNLKISNYLLNQEKMNKNIINKKTYKERMTAMGEFVDLVLKGEIYDTELYIKILTSLLNKGADINQGYSLNECTPFYQYISFLDYHLYSIFDSDNDKDIILAVKNATRNDILRMSSGEIFSKELYKEADKSRELLPKIQKVMENNIEYNHELIKRCVYILMECVNKEVINAVSYKGFTPLLAAAQAGEKEIFKKLLNKGADLYVNTDGGLTVLDICLREEHYELADFILQNYDIDKMIGLSSRIEYIILDVLLHRLHRHSYYNKKIINIIEKLAPFSIKLICYDFMAHHSKKLENILIKHGILKDEAMNYKMFYKYMEKNYGVVNGKKINNFARITWNDFIKGIYLR